jgi:hypothetical protein
MGSDAGGGIKREAIATAVHLALVAGFLYALIALGLRSWNDLAYLLREDGAFESLTSAFLFLTAAMAHLLAMAFRKAGRGWVAALFWTAAVLFFVGGMEEISWGQRILGIETPGALADVNAQSELNLHNLPAFHGGTEVKVFLVLSAYGALSGVAIALLLRWLPSGRRLRAFCENARVFTVPVRFAPYFLQMLVYVNLRRHDARMLQVFPEKRLIKELLEFLFVLGCFLTLFYRLRTETPAKTAAPAP